MQAKREEQHLEWQNAEHVESEVGSDEVRCSAHRVRDQAVCMERRMKTNYVPAASATSVNKNNNKNNNNLLAQLKSCRVLLRTLYSLPLYCLLSHMLSSFTGQLSKADKARIDSLFRKAFRRRFCCRTL